MKAQKGSISTTLPFCLTPAQDGGGLLTPRPGRISFGKETQYPLYRRLSGSRDRSGRARKISPSQRFESRTSLSIASCYITELSRPSFTIQRSVNYMVFIILYRFKKFCCGTVRTIEGRNDRKADKTAQ